MLLNLDDEGIIGLFKLKATWKDIRYVVFESIKCGDLPEDTIIKLLNVMAIIAPNRIDDLNHVVLLSSAAAMHEGSNLQSIISLGMEP